MSLEDRKGRNGKKESPEERGLRLQLLRERMEDWRRVLANRGAYPTLLIAMSMVGEMEGQPIILIPTAPPPGALSAILRRLADDLDAGRVEYS
jgi:hypothetical protein